MKPILTEGDTWDSAWLANDKVYVQFNDGKGFAINKWSRGSIRHDNIGELLGTPEDMSSISGINLNPGALGDSLGRDTYSTGIYEVDGVLYHNVCYSVQKPGAYRFYNGSTLKSTDDGANWINHLGQTNRVPRNKQFESMFPDDRWHQVNFVKYGKGGSAPNVDNAQTYVYLNSYYEGAYYLARIRREDLPTLDPRKIHFYTGGDGMLAESWTNQISRWKAITTPERLHPMSVVYNYGLGRYVSVGFRSDSRVQPPIESSLILLEAPHPWGPWTVVLEENVNHKEGDNLGWSYLLQKFTSLDGKKMWMTLSGTKYYGLQFMPIYLTTHPVQRLEAEDAALRGVAVAKDEEGYTGRGYVSGFKKTGDQCMFRVSVESRGAYLMKIRYNTSEYRYIELVVNGKLVERLKLGKSEQVYGKWTEMSLFAWLQRGENSISFRADNSGTSQGLGLDSLSVALYSEELQSSPDWFSPSVPEAVSRQ